MSKALGQKIAIKFTEKINPPGFITDLTSNIALNKKYTSNGIINYRGNNINNGDINSANYIEVNGTNMYIELDLGELLDISIIKVWHYYADNRIYNNTKVEVSEDGNIWQILFNSSISGTYTETSSGKEHILNTPVKARYVRDWINGSNKNAGNHWVEIVVYGSKLGYKKEGIKVTGREAKYINGPIIDKEYVIDKIERHPNYNDDKHLLLTTHPQSRFNNVIGSLTIEYDASKGILLGKGGGVESFIKTFSPVELIPLPNPNTIEKFKINASSNLEFIKVKYNKRYGEEKFTVSASVNIIFTYVGVVNP